jgi:hypothetical protein
MLLYYMAIWSTLYLFGIFRGLLVHGYLIFFPRFGMLYQEKSGNPGVDERRAF